MDNSLTFLYIFYFFSIVLHVVSIIISVFFVLPKQVIEMRQNNDGLNRLRQQLIVYRVTMVLLGVVSILALTSRYFTDGDVARYVVVGLVFSHAVGYTLTSVIDLLIRVQKFDVSGLFGLKVSQTKNPDQGGHPEIK